MKNFLSNLWSLSRTDRVRTLAIDAVSLPSFCRVNMLKLVSVLVILLSIGVGNVWGTEVNFTYSDLKGQGTSGSGSAFTGATKGDITMGGKGNGNSSYVQIYGGGTLTFTPLNGATITKIVLTGTSSTYIRSWNKSSGSISVSMSTATWTGSATSKVTLTNSASGQARITKMDVTYTASCTKIGAPTVTATPGDGRIDLSWSNQTGASSYSVTKTPAGGTVGTPSKSGSTWSCAITGLANGTTYTWSVEAVGSGDYCASGNTAASGSATPNVFRTITYYDKDGQHTTSLADGTNIATALTALYGGDDPVSCDATNYEYFVGWKVGEISGTASSVTLLDDEVVNSSSPSNNYYAVWSDTDPSAGGWTKVTSIAVGDVVVFAYDDAYKEMTGVTTTGTTYGSAAAVDPYPDDLSGDYALTVEAGNGGTGYSFKHGSVYLSWSSGNSLTTSGTKADASSWTISESSSGNFKFANVGDATRILQYNNGSPRWACYTSGQKAFQIYKQSGGGDAEYITTCCTDPELAYGTGSVTKTFGADVFTNTLTNSHSVAVTYSSSDETVATVNGSGQVTILKAGSTTITASSAAQTVAAVSYCADEASYTLTVNKASISPTLSYDPASVTVGSTLTSFTLSGNSGSGTVTYVSSNDAIATVNSSGVVTGVAPGTVTITATIAATTNYNGNTATSNTITVNAAACTGVNSLHTGNKDQGGWVTNQCFEDADWGAADDAIYVGAFPLTNECYVGWAGGNSYHGTYWAVGGIKTYDIPTGRTLGWNSGNYYESYPGGALGTFHIYKNSKDENYYLRFKPSSYILRTGSDGTSWTSREMTVSATNSHYYETAELDLTSTLISEHAYVDLKTSGGDGHVWCNFSNDRTASGNVKVKSSVGDADGNFRGDNLKASDNGTHGKFRIDVTKDVDNWKLAFVPMYRITYAPGTGASGSMDPSSYAEISTTIAAAANGFTAPTGKQFNGWSDGVNTYSAGDNVTMNSNVTLTAQWTDIDYTVTVNQNPSVGATTTGQTTTAHYNGTINLTTTVPSGYRFVNWTTSDGFSITNPTSATTASFTMPAKNVTVTANFQQTHTVDWYVGGSAPGNKLPSSGQTVVVDHGGSITTLPTSSQTSIDCDDKTFQGWTNTTSYTHGTSLLFTDAAGSPTITEATNFYAVFAAEGGSSEPTNKFSVTLNVATPSVPSGYTLSQATEWKNSTHRQDGSNDPAYIKVYHTSTKLFSSLPSTITIKAGLYGGSARDMSEDGSDYYPYVFFTDNSGNEIAGSAKAICTSVTNSSVEKSVDMDVSKATNAYGIGIRHKKISSFNLRYSSITLTYAESSYTGHTINCTSCANSVTVSYSDPGSGNTMSVTKGSTPIASGSSVKTCSAQSLTVTLTPATHYTVTNFAATGVTGVTTTNVGNVYTVNIPADKTGTLTLTPTFTPETPLTITLNTNNKGTFDPIGDVYSGESFTFPVVTPSDAECASFLGWIEGTTFDGAGETTDPSDVTSLPEYHAASTSSGTLTTNKTYTAVFGEKDTKETTAYVKVTSAPADWSGDYLIVRESIERAFNGSLETLDAANNYIDITIVDGKIAKGSLAANQFTIAKVGATDNYTIKSASGKYIGRTATSNGLDASTSTEYTNTLAYSSDHVVITSSGGPTLQMNGDTRFRYYASSQQELQLYKLGTAQMITYTYTTNPACTPRYRVTVNSAVGGSPSADKTYEHADEAITLTAHPAAGYSFTSWTITKTTGGDDVTTTLLGANATTANTSFSMPAYDVTVTASYAKIPVASLQVKDGETVIANSGTVNISTGANKTLTVVVTPADAFDHSWSASVTGGGTYASITNVQAGTFQVNGLAQGDATVTVTAPNDGDAKTVTFTVHVTDILPTEVVLKRDGSNTSISELSIYEGQYVKVNVSFTPTPTNKDFSVSADGTFVTIHAQAHTNPNYYATLNGKKVTTSPVNVTFTSAATSSVTKNLVVTVLPLLTDTFVDYIHGQATQTVSARLSADKFTLYTDINTPSLSDASDADPTSADCETSHYHLIGWLPKATAEALWAAGTAITESTEGLVKAGVQVEATGQTWYAIWGKEQ